MSETLPAHCAHCGQPVTLHVTGWPLFLDHVTMKGTDPPPGFVQHWTCPYCQTRNEGGFPGKMTLASKGHRASVQTNPKSESRMQIEEMIRSGKRWDEGLPPEGD